jgi:hypothetical protein
MTLEGKEEAFAAMDREMEIPWQMAGPALYVALMPTLNKSVEQCPKKSGTLAGTGRIDEPITEGDVTSCNIGFHTAYALNIHENLAINHPIHVDETGMIYNCTGKAKYLEDPIREDIEIIPDRIMQALNELGGIPK